MGHPFAALGAMSKRLFDLGVATCGVMVLMPLLLLIALAIKLDSTGPVLFRQERVGQGGRRFFIHKFRTMVVDAPALGLSITVGQDPRITRVGQWLRRSKLDELPQLLDVITGHMSLVGPRPEVPRYLPWYPADLKERVLSVRPGITDPVSLKFIDESSLLAQAQDPEKEYCEVILPLKLREAARYADHATLWTDVKILWATLRLLLRRSPHPQRPYT